VKAVQVEPERLWRKGCPEMDEFLLILDEFDRTKEKFARLGKK